MSEKQVEESVVDQINDLLAILQRRFDIWSYNHQHPEQTNGYHLVDPIPSIVFLETFLRDLRNFVLLRDKRPWLLAHLFSSVIKTELRPCAAQAMFMVKTPAIDAVEAKALDEEGMAFYSSLTKACLDAVALEE
jgi:hypothetical protein